MNDIEKARAAEQVRAHLGIDDPKSVSVRDLPKVNKLYIVLDRKDHFEVCLRHFELGDNPNITIGFTDTEKEAHELGKCAVIAWLQTVGKPLGAFRGQFSLGR